MGNKHRQSMGVYCESCVNTWGIHKVCCVFFPYFVYDCNLCTVGFYFIFVHGLFFCLCITKK